MGHKSLIFISGSPFVMILFCRQIIIPHGLYRKNNFLLTSYNTFILHKEGHVTYHIVELF